MARRQPGERQVLVRVLGPIEIRGLPDERWQQPRPQQRLVVALLAARLGSTCQADQLAEALWGDIPPENALRLLQATVSHLRRVLEPPEAGASRLRTVPGGWVLALDGSEVDAALFEELARGGNALADEGHLDAARRRLEEAADLWRGQPFGDAADHPALVADVTRLTEQRIAVEERVLDVRLQDGRHAELVPDLEAFVVRHPLRERAWGLLMEALCRSGRQADALAAYERLRERLVDELGAEPGPELGRLHEAILSREASVTGPDPSSRHSAATERRALAAAPVWPCRRDLPLVGRDPEFADLRKAYESIRSGQPQVVLLHGEPGIGKTRLVAELSDVVTQDGAVVLVGRCSKGGKIPYQPFVEALRADVEATPEEQLTARLGRSPGELVRVVPELAGHAGLAQPAPSISPELDQYRLFEAVAGWLAAASANAPLVLVIEDVHAATRPTHLLLRHVIGAVTRGRLLLLVTYRDTGEEMHAALVDDLNEFARRPNLTAVQLGGLRRTAVSDLVEARHPDLAERDRWAEAVHAATGGNPLFVEELLAALGEHRVAGPEGLLEHLSAPRGVRRLLEARIRRLSPATRRLLDQAAVAGERFDFGAVAQAAGLGENEALDALAEATGARLVAATASGGDHYRFVHAVMRAALLEAVTPSGRTPQPSRRGTAATPTARPE